MPVLLALCGVAVADTDAAPANGQDTPPVSPTLTRIDRAHGSVSNAVEAMARRIDRFFGDDRAFNEENHSTLRLSLDAIAGEKRSGGFDFSGFETGLRARWVLPRTQQRLRLIVEHNPTRTDADEPEPSLPRALKQPIDYLLGLEGDHRLGDWQLRPSLGIAADLPLGPYARMRAIRYQPLGSWLARAAADLSWFDADGTRVGATLDFDRKLSDRRLFRSASAARWDVDDAHLELTQLFSLFRNLAPRTTLAYDIGVTADDDPGWRLQRYFAGIRYRRLVYRNWAFVEIQPQLSWPDESDFDAELSLLVRLEINFGRPYL